MLCLNAPHNPNPLEKIRVYFLEKPDLNLNVKAGVTEYMLELEQLGR